MVQEEDSLVYKVEDIQRMLNVGRSAIYEGLRMKIIPCLRLGRRYVIPRAAFHRWLDESTATNGAAPSKSCPFCRPSKQS